MFRFYIKSHFYKRKEASRCKAQTKRHDCKAQLKCEDVFFRKPKKGES